MKEFTFNYPGDGPKPCLLVNREEFLKLFPRQPIEIRGANYQLLDSIPVPPDCIICDCCNEDPKDTIYVVEGSRAYCQECAREYVLPYCTSTPKM